MTPKQQSMLAQNPHLVVAATLEDGDMLVLDNQPAANFPSGHFGPYILTKSGALQDVNYHYSQQHGKAVPWK